MDRRVHGRLPALTGNPLRDEATAFRWVLGTIAYLTPIVVASWISTWLGIAVFVVLSGVAVWRLVAGRDRPEPASGERADVDDTPEP